MDALREEPRPAEPPPPQWPRVVERLRWGLARTRLHLTQIQRGKPSAMPPCHLPGPFPNAASTGRWEERGTAAEAAGTVRRGLQSPEAGASKQCPVKESPQASFWQDPPRPTPGTHSGGQAGPGALCWGLDHPAGYNFHLIPSWTRRGEPASSLADSSALERSLKPKCGPRPGGIATSALRAVFVL